jgi:tetratricopeptide (TPR) repeat protein
MTRRRGRWSARHHSRRASIAGMPELDDLWDFDDPVASEGRFRGAIEAAEAGGDPWAADEARTQLARALGLQGRFEDGHNVLDRVDADHTADDRIRVRARLERGRLRRSSGDVAASMAPLEGAWELARTLGEDGLAVDAAHMLALVAAPPGEPIWHERALELAGTSPDPAARRWRGSLWNNIGWARFDAGDLDGALAAFDTALGARREQGQPKETRIAEWCVARCIRALGRPAEALAIQGRLAAERAAAGEPERGFGDEEIGECLLDLGRDEEARPYFARAAELLGADGRLMKAEPDRIARLRRLGGG